MYVTNIAVTPSNYRFFGCDLPNARTVAVVTWHPLRNVRFGFGRKGYRKSKPNRAVTYFSRSPPACHSCHPTGNIQRHHCEIKHLKNN